MLDGGCLVLIKQIDDAVGRRANRALGRDGLTLSQARMVMELGDAPAGVPLKELERRFRVAQPTIVGIVQRLEVKGLVEKVAEPHDNRVKIVRLTKAGQAYREATIDAITDMEATLLAPLDADERPEFRRMLRLVRDGIC